eukprot:Skav216363  [mRNA]  locus=scaffold1517:25280:37158:+ [translate_table: standard]
MASRQVWEVHPSPYGVPYYYNAKTKESRWSVPTGPLDIVVPPEEAKKNPVVNGSAKEKKKDEEKGVQAFDTFDQWLPRLDWRRFRLTEDLDSFATWLRQSPELHEVRGPAAMEELCALEGRKLQSDIRYRRLDWVPGQRMKLITSRLEEIAAGRVQGEPGADHRGQVLRHGACCTRTCAKYDCSEGWAPNPQVGVSDEVCCKKKCVQYQDQCTGTSAQLKYVKCLNPRLCVGLGDYAPNPAANDTVGETAEICCSRALARHGMTK